jgi:hypothetical protein
MQPHRIIRLALLGLFAACATPDGSPGDDFGVTAVQFQDIVVPDGMTLLNRRNESHSREEPGWRYGHFEYTGQPRVDDACAHVLLRMPQHSWRLVADEQPDEATRRLQFVRGRYVAEYTLERRQGLTRMVIDYRTDIEAR